MARDPNGQQLEWDAQIVEDQPGEHLRWASLAGADVPTEGDVSFRAAPGDRGTEVRLRLRFDPATEVRLRLRFDPATGAHRVTVANILGEVPNLIAGKVLRRFKQKKEDSCVRVVLFRDCC